MEQIIRFSWGRSMIFEIDNNNFEVLPCPEAPQLTKTRCEPNNIYIHKFKECNLLKVVCSEQNQFIVLRTDENTKYFLSKKSCPFFKVNFYIKWTRLLGHIVCILDIGRTCVRSQLTPNFSRVFSKSRM